MRSCPCLAVNMYEISRHWELYLVSCILWCWAGSNPVRLTELYYTIVSEFIHPLGFLSRAFLLGETSLFIVMNTSQSFLLLAAEWSRGLIPILRRSRALSTLTALYSQVWVSCSSLLLALMLKLAMPSPRYQWLFWIYLLGGFYNRFFFNTS